MSWDWWMPPNWALVKAAALALFLFTLWKIIGAYFIQLGSRMDLASLPANALNTNLVYLAPPLKLLLWGIQWQQLTWQYRTEMGSGKLSCLLSTYSMKCGLIQQQSSSALNLFSSFFFSPWDALRNLLYFFPPSSKIHIFPVVQEGLNKQTHGSYLKCL